MLLVSAALMIAWSSAFPVFEGSDEAAHWRYANYLNQNHALPLDGPSCPEAAQPPLYYLLIAPLAVDVNCLQFAMWDRNMAGEIFSSRRGYIKIPREIWDSIGHSVQLDS